MFLHETQKWAQNELGGDLDAMRLGEKQFQFEDFDKKMDRAQSGKGLFPKGERPPDPEFEELIGDYVR